MSASVWDPNITPSGSVSSGVSEADEVELLSWSSGIPFVMPSNYTINNTAGAITVTTGFDYVIGPSYAFFPALKLNATSPAGWYYTVWTAATLATVYADNYMNGVPEIPASPTALVTVAGSYTQVTGYDVPGPCVIIPAAALGVNGTIEWQRACYSNNSAGTKTFNTYLAGILEQGLSQTTNPKEAGMGTIKNRGKYTSQIAAQASHGDNANVSSFTKSFIDTEKSQIFNFTMQLNTATDFAVMESWLVRVTKEN
jgi:hypothetical protein